MERARAFERMSVGLGAVRALKHERYLYESRGGLANIVPIDTDRYAAPESLAVSLRRSPAESHPAPLSELDPDSVVPEGRL